MAWQRDPAERVHLDDDFERDEQHNGHLDEHGVPVVHVLLEGVQGRLRVIKGEGERRSPRRNRRCSRTLSVCDAAPPFRPCQCLAPPPPLAPVRSQAAG